MLARIRALGVVEGGLYSPPVTEDLPDRADMADGGLDMADWGRAVASLGASVDSGLTLWAGQKMPLPGSHAKYCTLGEHLFNDLVTCSAHDTSHSPLHTTIILALSCAASNQLEASVLAWLESNRTQMPKHSNE